MNMHRNTLLPVLVAMLILGACASATHSTDDGAAAAPGTTAAAEPERDLTANRPYLAAQVRALGIDEFGNEGSFVQSRVEEFISRSMRPLLPYLFFEENSAKIPPRYQLFRGSDTTGFCEDRLFGLDELKTYYHMLNVLARRLQRYPDAILTLTGCNADIDDEKSALELSERRAEAVRRYLVDVWGIPESRIRVSARNMPEKHSSQVTPDGAAENRRVEISSNDPRMLAPVITRDTLRIATPPMIRFLPDVSSDAGVLTWELAAMQQGSGVLRRFTGEGALPEFIDWDLNNDPSSIPRKEEFLEYTLEIRDREGQRYLATGTPIPVEQITLRKKRIERVADKSIDRYRLILFDIGDADLKSEQKVLIRDLRGTIMLNSEVKIAGYTDRLGDSEANKALSLKRAQAVAREIDAAKTTVKGLGESRMLHDNSSPEGRFYCRTVSVTIETPIQY